LKPPYFRARQNSRPPAYVSWSVWGLGALLYLFGFYQRVAPAVMTTELMNDFGIGAAALGHLSAFYFYSYVAMQIPTGVLVDTWGPHRLLTAGACGAGVGSLLFATASSALGAGFGRLLIGGSVSVAWAVGSPFFGAISDRLGRRKLPYIVGCAVATVGWGLILFVAPQPIYWLIVVILVTGFASGCMIISFAYVKESVPPDLTGTVSGLVNMGVILGLTLLQPAVGWVLDRRWNGLTLNGARIYDLDAFRIGFSLMFGWMVLAFILLFFTREINCRQVVTLTQHAKQAMVR
jgi:MFS family permease